jgi:hypothetical protein
MKKLLIITFCFVTIFAGLIYFMLFYGNKSEESVSTLEQECEWKYGVIEDIILTEELKSKIKIDDSSKTACCYNPLTSDLPNYFSCYWIDGEFYYIIDYTLEDGEKRYSDNYAIMPLTTKNLGRKTLDKIVSFSDEEIVFSETTSEIESISIGDILIIGVTEYTPHGAMKKVVSIDKDRKSIKFS